MNKQNNGLLFKTFQEQVAFDCYHLVHCFHENHCVPPAVLNYRAKRCSSLYNKRYGTIYKRYLDFLEKYFDLPIHRIVKPCALA